MFQEQPCAAHNPQTIAPTIPTTTALLEVIAETFKNAVVHLADWQVSSDCPTDNVFRCSNVSTCGHLRIAVLKQVVGETFNQRCGRITVDLTNPCRCLKEMGKHDEPPRGLVGRRRMSFLCGVTNRSGANFALPVPAMTVNSPTRLRITIFSALNHYAVHRISGYPRFVRVGRRATESPMTVINR